MVNFNNRALLLMIGAVAFIALNYSVFKLSQNHEWAPHPTDNLAEVNLEQTALFLRAQLAVDAYQSQTGETITATKNEEVKYEDPVIIREKKELQFETVQVIKPTAPPIKSIQSVVISTKKNVVIGMALAISYKNLAVFVKSLRNHCSPEAVDIVLLMDMPSSKLILDLLSTYSVTPIYFSTLEPSLDGIDFETHPSSYRWPMISSYLTQHKDKYSKALLADIRDTYFQSDPFLLLSSSSSGLLTWNEGDSTTIRNCGWNSGWIRDCFGAAILTSVGSKPIICSGISIGHIPVVLNYVNVMSDVISGNIDNYPLFPSCERNGVDQGVHNVVMHLSLIENTVVLSQENGLVIHLQAKKAIVSYSDNDSILVRNMKNEPVVIVHQYDRDKRLQEVLFEKFGANVKEEEKSDSCVGFTLGEENYDSYKGICDLMKVAVVDVTDCCPACRANAKCLGFTFYNDMCFLKSCKGSVKVRIAGATSGMKN